jgi:surface polysaccharide O-acyltransferase-like enzyme
MALAYLIWATVYALHSASPGAGFRELVHAAASGHYHLWYLPFLCGVYLMLPFLQKIAEDEHLTAQLLGLSLVIAQGIPWMVDLAAVLLPEWSKALRAVENHLHFTFFFDLLSLLLLGHLLARREISQKARRLLYGAGILSIPLTLAGTVFLTGVTGSPSSIFFDHASPTTLCAGAALFVFAKYHLTALPRWAAWLADRSFGVYLIHVLVLELLAQAGWDVLAFAPAWWTPVLALAVFGISAIAAAILQKVPVLGKYLA